MTERDWWDSVQAKDIYHRMKKHQVTAGCQTICQINRCRSKKTRKKILRKWTQTHLLFEKSGSKTYLTWEFYYYLYYHSSLNYTFFGCLPRQQCSVRHGQMVAMKLLRTSACVLKVFWGTTKTELRIYVNKFIEGLGDVGRGAGTLTQYSGYVYDISFRWAVGGNR